MTTSLGMLLLRPISQKVGPQLISFWEVIEFLRVVMQAFNLSTKEAGADRSL